MIGGDSVDTLLINEDILREFCISCVPKLENDEVLIAMLAARKKYGGVSRSQEMLDKLIIKRSDADYIVRKMRKFCYVEGCYVDSKTGEELSRRCMAVYIDLIPRHATDAVRIFNNETYKWLFEVLNGGIDSSIFRKIDSKLFSAIARSSSRRWCCVIDIDSDDKSILDKVIESVGDYIFWISKTRGGYHVLVRYDKEVGRIIYNELNKYDCIEVFRKQAMTPVPGTLQGGFVVKKVDW